MRNYKLDNKVQQEIATANLKTSQPGYGIVMEYNSTDNTATVLLAQPGSDIPGEFHRKVPCPTTFGVQSVAPEVGRPCWVTFRDGLQSSPVITHYFHHDYENMEYDAQYYAKNQTPRFMLEM